MPELPEVETVRSGLEPLLLQQKVKEVTCYRQTLRYPLPDFSGLIGRRITTVGRRSKYLLFHFDHGQTVVWHLGMTGQFHLLPQDNPKGSHEHVRIDLNQGVSLRYRDARRFGYAGIVKTDLLYQHPWFAGLGPEPLGDAFSCDYMASICRGRKVSIKSLIMDASIVVGVGNIYASESLFRAGIHPARAAGRISSGRLKMLTESIKTVLREAIAAGGSSISDFVKADGKPGYFSHQFRVYGHAGEPCSRCRRSIRRIVQSGRSTFYCSGCQH